MTNSIIHEIEKKKKGTHTHTHIYIYKVYYKKKNEKLLLYVGKSKY